MQGNLKTKNIAPFRLFQSNKTEIAYWYTVSGQHPVTQKQRKIITNVKLTIMGTYVIKSMMKGRISTIMYIGYRFSSSDPQVYAIKYLHVKQNLKADFFFHIELPPLIYNKNRFTLDCNEILVLNTKNTNQRITYLVHRPSRKNLQTSPFLSVIIT